MMDTSRQRQVRERAARVRHDDHELSVFNLHDLVDDILKLNEKIKDEANTDMVALAQLAKSGGQVSQEIKLLGVLGMAYVKTALDGERYLIFKGYAGGRPNLSGTRYALENPKVSCFVVGGRELLKDGAKATRIAVLAYVVIDVVQEINGDQFCLSRLLAHVASDIIQAVVATAVGVGAGMALGALVVLGGAAAAPVVVVFAVTVGAGYLASMEIARLDREYHLTERLVKASMALEDGAKEKERRFVSAFDQAVTGVEQTASDTYQSAVVVYGVALKIYRVWQSAHEMMHGDL